MNQAVPMVKPEELAEELQTKLNSLHDPIVSDNPFAWTNTEEDLVRQQKTFEGVSDKLSAFQYIPKGTKILKIIGFGAVLPLAILGVLYLLDVPVDENTRLLVWGGLVVAAIISAITAAVVASNPSLDEDLALALCTAPRNWSFSRINGRETWNEYRNRFGYFDQGDEDQSIHRRLWGYLDENHKRAFQLFHFYFEEVYYTTEAIRNSKGNVIGYRQVKHEIPHDRYGAFVQMPESRIRFRITETGNNPGFDAEIKLEYGALNKAVSVYCNASDELAVRQFLSPAVQEIVMAFSEWLPDLILDFHPGFVMLAMTHNPFEELEGIEFDENATKFAEILKPGIDNLVAICSGIGEKLQGIAKYNDNY